MKVWIMAIAVFACAIIANGQALEIDNGPYFGVLSQLEVANGRKMMQIKGIPEGDVNGEAISWNFPTSVVVRSSPYRVVRGGAVGDFKILEPTGDIRAPLAHGEITRMENGMFSRICGFGRMSTSNLGVLAMSLQTEVRVLDSATNAIYLASVHKQEDVEEVLIYKNIFMRISGSTNKVDLAIALLNAGLPESERLPSMQPPRP